MDELTRKATRSGVTYFKMGRQKKRYTGSSLCAVDINGRLLLKRELEKELKGSEPAQPKRKARVETQAAQCENMLLNTGAISHNLSTTEIQQETAFRELSTTSPRKKEYRIKAVVVRQRLLSFINTQKGKKELYFWTVTFPMGTTDKIAYQLFNTWLTKLRQRKMLKEYLWVAERQGEKSKIGNTTIHFHIAIPHKMSVQYSNVLMRESMMKFCRSGEIPFSVYQCKRYNGVDIAKHRNTKRVTNFAIKKGAKALAVYLTKYVTKNDQKFEHLAWHNSRGFSALFTAVAFTKQEFAKNGLFLHLDFSRRRENEYFVFVPWNGDPPDILLQHLYELNSYVLETYCAN